MYKSEQAAGAAPNPEGDVSSEGSEESEEKKENLGKDEAVEGEVVEEDEKK